MAPGSTRVPTAVPSSIGNKAKRHEVRLKQKKAQELSKRDARFKRKREESKNPQLRAERLEQNKQKTLDNKRVWDDFVDDDDDNLLGKSVDLQAERKRQKLESEVLQTAADPEGVDSVEEQGDGAEEDAENDKDDESDVDSMLADSDVDDADEAEDHGDEDHEDEQSTTPKRPLSPTASINSTTLAATPEALAAKFPSLFASPLPQPKTLITTSLAMPLHAEAKLLTSLFPSSTYVPRQKHHHSHKFSLREIATFAANRHYTALVVLNSERKRPSGLDIVHLPSGPTFHFSLRNWVPGAALPGHGKPTAHAPELILNGFRTPLGVLTAALFRTLFPAAPDAVGRQVVTLHNQRDFVFLRRHRYVFRDRRETEKRVLDADGAPLSGVEAVKAGLQELGPRFALKLRRVDRGVQRSSGQEWEWKTKTDGVRTKFQL